MKKILLFCLAISAQVSTIWGQITLTKTNYPLVAGTIQNYHYPKNSVVFTEGTGTYWAADSNKGVKNTPIVFVSSTNTKFPNCLSTNNTSSLGSYFTIPITTYWRESAGGIFGIGYSNADTIFDISKFTYGTGDKLEFLAHTQSYPDSIKLMQFPATYKSSWKSVTRDTVKYKATISSQSLSNTPGFIVSYEHHRDTIVGYGTMSVRTQTYPYHSIHYNVLMDKVIDFNIDSFYLGGIVPSSLILGALSVSEGQKSEISCRYNFYRQNHFAPLLTMNFGTDSTYKSQTSVIYNVDSLTSATGVTNLSIETTAALIYPNPSNSHLVNVKLFGSNVNQVNCRLFDMSGKEAMFKKLYATGNAEFAVNTTGITNGLYVIQLTDLDNNILVSETLSIQH